MTTKYSMGSRTGSRGRKRMLVKATYDKCIVVMQDVSIREN